MEQKIIAFVGMPGSGKGTCTDYLHKKYNWPVIHFGNMVYEEVQRRGLDNVKDEVFVREDMRKQEGPAVLAKHVARKAQQYLDEGQSTVVLDGLYSWTEYKYLEKTFGENLIVIAVVAPKKVF
jgi:dephospho-CoA kinase